MKGGLRAILLTFIVLLTSSSGCFGKDEKIENIDQTTYPSIWDRHALEWNTSHTHSFLLEKGPHTALDVQEAFIDIDTTGV